MSGTLRRVRTCQTASCQARKVEKLMRRNARPRESRTNWEKAVLSRLAGPSDRKIIYKQRPPGPAGSFRGYCSPVTIVYLKYITNYVLCPDFHPAFPDEYPYNLRSGIYPKIYPQCQVSDRGDACLRFRNYETVTLRKNLVLSLASYVRSAASIEFMKTSPLSSG